MLCSLSLSKEVELARQMVAFSYALVRYQSSIVLYLAVQKMGSIVTKIVFAVTMLYY